MSSKLRTGSRILCTRCGVGRRAQVNWQGTSPGLAAQPWNALRAWMGRFRVTFGLDHRVVPCWYLHPALVQVLSALRDHWFSAYNPLNSRPAASERYRVFAQLEPRLRECEPAPTARPASIARTWLPPFLMIGIGLAHASGDI